MKKRVLPMLLILLVLLSGCSCTHEWTQADCLNPQTCAKCGETGEAALGHDWSEASCTQPQVCRRCSATQGEPVDHLWGEWSFGETEMSRSCSSCGYAETAGLDREIQLAAYLPGLWEFYGMYQGESFYSAYNFPILGDSLTFGQDRRVTGIFDQAPFSGSWEFSEYQDEEEEQRFYFHVNGDDGRVLQMMYKKGADIDAVYGFFANDVQTILSRNDHLARTVLGTWGAKGIGSFHSLTFHEDRTVTGNLDLELDGTWQVLPVRDMGNPLLNDRRSFGIYIRYLKDGEEQLLTAVVSPPAIYGEDPVPEEFAAKSITITLNGTRLTFEAMSQEEIDAQRKAMEEGPNMLVGTWSSMYVRSFHTEPCEDTLSLDYTVTFAADGTFTGSVGKQISGQWVYDDSRGDESRGRHTYYLLIQGDSYPYDMELEYTDSQVPVLSIESRSTTPGDRQMLFLNKRSAQQDTMFRSLIGTWSSIYEQQMQPGSSSYDRVNTMAYSFTFREDGTFTGNDGTPLEGTWVYERTRDDTVHQYNLFLSGQTQEYAALTLYDHSDSGDEAALEYNPRSDDAGIRYIYLAPFTPEEWEAAQNGPTYILGQWQTDTGDCSITIHEDGTFTANLAESVQGTWSFHRYKPDSKAFWYNFTFPGQKEYCDKTMYAHTDEDMLTFRFETETFEEFYQMHRSK